MPSAFEKAVLAGIRFLRELPRGRAEMVEAQKRLHAFRAAHRVRADLVADWTSASRRVDYDLLLPDDTHGTLALSQAQPASSPWNSAHAEHWAAQRVATIDGEALSVHDALRLWQARAALGPSWMQALLDEALLSRAQADEEESGEDVEGADEEAVKARAREIRGRLGLGSPAQVQSWLREHGLPATGLEDLARAEVQRERWLDRLFAADGAAFFEKNQRDFDSVTVAWAIGPKGALTRLATRRRAGASLLATVERSVRARGAELIEAKLERCSAWQLPAAMRRASPGAWVGPVVVEGKPRIGEVLTRSPRDLGDEDIRATVRDRLLARWLRRARASSHVQWHWL